MQMIPENFRCILPAFLQKHKHIPTKTKCSGICRGVTRKAEGTTHPPQPQVALHQASGAPVGSRSRWRPSSACRWQIPGSPIKVATGQLKSRYTYARTDFPGTEGPCVYYWRTQKSPESQPSRETLFGNVFFQSFFPVILVCVCVSILSFLF